jgi:hypothetical protein
MEVDQYWRTRTVAEAMKDYTCLRLTCACGRITDNPFALLLQRRGQSRSFLGSIRFKCQELISGTTSRAFPDLPCLVLACLVPPILREDAGTQDLQEQDAGTQDFREQDAGTQDTFPAHIYHRLPRLLYRNESSRAVSLRRIHRSL